MGWKLAVLTGAVGLVIGGGAGVAIGQHTAKGDAPKECVTAIEAGDELISTSADFIELLGEIVDSRARHGGNPSGAQLSETDRLAEEINEKESYYLLMSTACME